MKKAIVLGMLGILIAGGCYLVSARGISATETVMATNVVNSNKKIVDTKINDKLKVKKTRIKITSEKINNKTETFEGKVEIPEFKIPLSQLQDNINDNFEVLR